MLWSDMPAYEGVTLFSVDSVPWPYPTLLRYHLFLQQEEYLKKFDKLLYLDCDMRVLVDIGTEIFGEGLTCAQHPMYALDRRYIPPYEPNPNSSAFIPRFGVIKTDNKKIWFDPVYAAGGIQGGTTQIFLDAMWAMKRAIDRDLQNNYIAIWNDESHWNYYLSQNPRQDLIVLDPGYVHPDSLVEEYYHKIWGCKYQPKILTLTKKHTLSKQGGADVAKMLGTPEAISPIVCATCHDVLTHPNGFQLMNVVVCRGSGQQHDCEMLVLAGSQNICPTCSDILPGYGIGSVTSCGGVGGLHHFTGKI